MLYIVISIFETDSDSPTYEPLYSEELSAIEASCEEEAKEKAINKGKASEHSYKNQYGNTINVRFKAVIDAQEPVDNEALSGEGTLYVRHFRDYSAYEAFEPFLKGKAL